MEAVVPQTAEEGCRPWKQKLTEAMNYFEAGKKQVEAAAAMLEVWPRDKEWFQEKAKMEKRRRRNTCGPGANPLGNGSAHSAANGLRRREG